MSRSLDGYLSRKLLPRAGADALIRQLTVLLALGEAEFGDEDFSDLDRALASLLAGMAADTRCFLAVHLSVTATPPPTLLQRLARDAIEIARPLLLHSPALRDADLVAIADATGPAHMAAIARRLDLGCGVTDSLVARGTDGVRRDVAGNHSAALSNESFRRLSRQARDDPRLEEQLIHRADLPPIVLRYLLRHRAGRMPASPEREEALPGESPRWDVEWRAPARTGEAWSAVYDFAAAEERVATLAEQGQRGERLLVRLVAEERFPEVAALVAALARTERERMLDLLTAADPRPFLPVAARIGLEPRTLFALLHLGPWGLILDGRCRHDALCDYRALCLARRPDEEREAVRAGSALTATASRS